MSESYKVALLGEAGVGKVDIINAFVYNTFVSDSHCKGTAKTSYPK
jgi:GTPase SAR1 family protein